jgi:heme/copper-type cytochrome/quinol oxidase subunit 3
MNVVETLDLSHLEKGAVGPRAPLWWGTVGMIAIESTVFALAIASYFYLRMRYTEWPPADAGPPSLLLPTINVLVMLASIVPQYMIDAAAKTADRAKLERLLIAASVLGVIACVLRVWDFKALHCDWTEHSYGSIVWALVGAHSIHLYASTFETILMAAAVSEVELDNKHRLDLNVNAVYWFFVVIAWLFLYAVIWGAGRAL